MQSDCFFVGALGEWCQARSELFSLGPNEGPTKDRSGRQLNIEDCVLISHDVLEGDRVLLCQSRKQLQHLVDKSRLGRSVGEVGMAALFEQDHRIGCPSLGRYVDPYSGQEPVPAFSNNNLAQSIRRNLVCGLQSGRAYLGITPPPPCNNKTATRPSSEYAGRIISCR